MESITRTLVISGYFFAKIKRQNAFGVHLKKQCARHREAPLKVIESMTAKRWLCNS